MKVSQCCECGTRFVSPYQRKYCDNCRSHRNRTTNRRIHNVSFVGVDGEGVNRPDGTHEYILLSVGNDSLYYPDGRGLTFYDIMPFLWNRFLENPDLTYVGFYLGYDFTMWLRDLPENRARTLLTSEGIASRSRTKSGGNHLPFPVEHRGWHFDILGMKRFRLWYGNDSRRMYICDAGSYFQSSFLKVIDPDPENWPSEGGVVGAPVSEMEYKKIMLGKSERGEVLDYGSPVPSEMIEYNVLENDVLARVMKQYNRGLVDIDVRLKRDQWFGPGQAAQKWMFNVKAPKRESFSEKTNIDIRNILRNSYYGGWFEIFAHGHILGTSWSYDINSAYPFIQSNLPCCLHGKWTKGIGHEDGIMDRPYCLVHCTINSHNSHMGPAPFRLPNNTILRPGKVKGWYWAHEIREASKAGLVTNIDIEEWLDYDPCNCPPPFRDLATLYNERLSVGKNTIRGKSRKLVYNSAYGKTAQSLGTAKYANPFYASFITSYCRTQILNAIATHPKGVNDVLMVATDSVSFKSRHTNLTSIDNEKLGSWSEEPNENLTLFMPGIYWDDRTREKLRNGSHPSLKSRGIPARFLANKIFEIDDMFADNDYIFGGYGWPKIELPIKFSIISPKQALAWNRWHDCGRIEFDKTRIIDSDPYLKRSGAYMDSDRIIRSYCYPEAPFPESTPYNKTFGDEQLLMLQQDMTPDGIVEMLLSEALE